jgi:hypothetical protein
MKARLSNRLLEFVLSFGGPAQALENDGNLGPRDGLTRWTSTRGVLNVGLDDELLEKGPSPDAPIQIGGVEVARPVSVGRLEGAPGVG